MLDKENNKQSVLVRSFIFSNLLFWSLNLYIFDLKISINILFIIFISLFLRNKDITNFYLFLNLLIIYGVIVSLFSYNIIIINRSLGSSVLFLYLLYSIFKISNIVNCNIPIISIYDAKLSLIIITFASFLGAIFNLKNGMPIWNLSNGGLYSEQSHAALTFVPLFLYLYKNSGSKYFLLFIFFIFLFSSFSTTLILSMGIYLMFLQLAVIFKNGLDIKKLYTILIIFIFFLIILLYSDFGLNIVLRFNDIVNFSNTSNLSSTVYLNAWSMAFSNLFDSYFFGIGFNVMGYNNYANNQYLDLMRIWGTDNIGIKDGTFYFSKLLSEFGFLAFFFFIYLFIILYKVINNKNILFHNWLLIYFFLSVVAIGGFIRSVGYFTGPFILFLFFLFIYKKRI